MSELLLTNIGMLTTPTGSSARSGAEQGQIQILRKSRRSKTGLKPHAGKFTGKTGTGGCHL